MEVPQLANNAGTKCTGLSQFDPTTGSCTSGNPSTTQMQTGNTGGNTATPTTSSIPIKCTGLSQFDPTTGSCTSGNPSTTRMQTGNTGIGLGAKCLVGEHLDEFGRCSTAAESVHQPLFAPSLKTPVNVNTSSNTAAESVPIYPNGTSSRLTALANPASTSAESVQNPGNSYTGSAAKCLIGQHIGALGRCVNDISNGLGGITIGTHTVIHNNSDNNWNYDGN